MFRFLDKQTLAYTLGHLQQVHLFDVIYNAERRHRALPGRVTPLQAWEATPKADPQGWSGHSGGTSCSVAEHEHGGVPQSAVVFGPVGDLMLQPD